LKSYSKCSEFYHRGGVISNHFGLRVVKHAVEKFILMHLKGGRIKPDLHSCLLSAIAKENQSENLIEAQMKKYMNKSVIWLQNFNKIFPFDKYEPITARIEPRAIISKTPIDVEISGIFRSLKNKTLHAITFASYSGRHSALNDPSTVLKLKLLQPYVKKHIQSNRPQVLLHIFGYGKNHNIKYYSFSSNEIKESAIERIKDMVKLMEYGYHFPVTPCMHKCPFKQNCYPMIQDD